MIDHALSCVCQLELAICPTRDLRHEPFQSNAARSLQENNGIRRNPRSERPPDLGRVVAGGYAWVACSKRRQGVTHLTHPADELHRTRYPAARNPTSQPPHLTPHPPPPPPN